MSDSDLIRRGDAKAVATQYTHTMDDPRMEAEMDAIPAVATSQPADPVMVTVKPLVWEAFGKECLRAETALGRYEIMWGFHNGQTSLDIPASRRNHVWHNTADAAKAAAQADYESRILAAIDAHPNRALHWIDGEPPGPYRNEWFIAKTVHGDKVVLRSLPDDWTYDYTTADHTYMIATNIVCWMQFPDSEYVAIGIHPDRRDVQIAALVDALEVLKMWDAARGYQIPHHVRDLILAAIKGAKA